MADQACVAGGLYCQKGERITVLELKCTDVLDRLDKIEQQLNHIDHAITKEEAGRDMVYSIGKWTIWVIMAIATMFGWDKIAAWLSKNPL